MHETNWEWSQISQIFISRKMLLKILSHYWVIQVLHSKGSTHSELYSSGLNNSPAIFLFFLQWQSESLAALATYGRRLLQEKIPCKTINTTSLLLSTVEYMYLLGASWYYVNRQIGCNCLSQLWRNGGSKWWLSYFRKKNDITFIKDSLVPK